MILPCSVMFFWDFVRLGLGVDLPIQNNLQDLRVAGPGGFISFFQASSFLWTLAWALFKVWTLSKLKQIGNFCTW